MGVQLSKRQAQIAEMIHHQDFISVQALALHFKVTAQTIRRDLNCLCDQGIARRRHGGVQKANPNGNLSYGWRQILNSHAKQQIARAVANHIPHGVSLAFSIGTTPEIVSRELLKHENLRFFTNNLNVAMLACANPTFEVSIAGGRLRNEDRDVLGAGTESMFQAIKVDIGIYGVAGVDDDGALLDFYEEEVRARQIIHANCRQAFLVLDHAKFGRAAYVRGGHITQADKIFCDRRPPDDIVALIHQSRAELIICTEEPS